MKYILVSGQSICTLKQVDVCLFVCYITYPWQRREKSFERNDGNGGSCGWLVIPPLIGIHGRAEAYAYGGKSGANMGIPIHRILKNFQNDFLNEGIKKLPKEEETKLYIEGCPLFNR